MPPHSSLPSRRRASACGPPCCAPLRADLPEARPSLSRHRLLTNHPPHAPPPIISPQDAGVLSDLAYDASVAFADVFSVGLFSVLLLFGVFLNQDQMDRVESLEAHGIMESAMDKVRAIEAANRKLFEENESMAATMRLQRVFLGNISHELR